MSWSGYFSIFLPWCLCNMYSWAFPSFSLLFSDGLRMHPCLIPFFHPTVIISPSVQFTYGQCGLLWYDQKSCQLVLCISLCEENVDANDSLCTKADNSIFISLSMFGHYISRSTVVSAYRHDKVNLWGTWNLACFSCSLHLESVVMILGA